MQVLSCVLVQVEPPKDVSKFLISHNTPRHATPHRATPHHATPRHTTTHYTTPCHIGHAAKHHATPRHSTSWPLRKECPTAHPRPWLPSQCSDSPSPACHVTVPHTGSVPGLFRHGSMPERTPVCVCIYIDVCVCGCVFICKFVYVYARVCVHAFTRVERTSSAAAAVTFWSLLRDTLSAMVAASCGVKWPSHVCVRMRYASAPKSVACTVNEWSGG